MFKKNLISNYFGQGWNALMSFAFIPLYIKYIGIESYGLIGFYGVLQSIFTLLDMGLTPTLGREMARFTGGGRNVESVKNLLRTIEIIGIIVSLIIIFIFSFGSDWISVKWVKSDSISKHTVANAFFIMGIVIALRLLEGIYRSALIGMQRQVIYNILNSIMVTFRGFGAIVVLKWVSPTIHTFFFWQALISFITLIILGIATYKSLPKVSHLGYFSYNELKGISKFASGMLGITLLKLMLTQIDKVILSKYLTLSDFGYYTLATTVASSLLILVSPVIIAIYPRFCELHAQDDYRGFAENFHKGSQIVSVIAGSFCITMIFFSQTFLEVWTQDINTAKNVSPLLIILSAGTLLNGLMWIPHQAQLAYKLTKFPVLVNLISVIFLVPAIIFIVPKYGPISAAWIWLALNCGYFFISGGLMYTKILKYEKTEWYIHDVIIPLAFITISISLVKIFSPYPTQLITQIFCLSFSVILSIVSGSMVSKHIRIHIFRTLNIEINKDSAKPENLI